MPYETFFNLSEDKRASIINASIDEFSENGYDKTSISNIIKKARIPRGSFYQYFDNKLDLYKYILEYIGNKKHEYTKDASQTTLDMNFIDIIRNLFVGGVHFYRKHPNMAKVANDFLLIRDQKVKKFILGDGADKSKKFFHTLINEGKDRGEIDTNLDNETIILFIHSLNQSFAEQFIEKVNSDYYDNRLFEMIDQMMLFLEKGLSTNSNEMGNFNEKI